jgi:hypothetical protein
MTRVIAPPGQNSATDLGSDTTRRGLTRKKCKRPIPNSDRNFMRQPKSRLIAKIDVHQEAAITKEAAMAALGREPLPASKSCITWSAPSGYHEH